MPSVWPPPLDPIDHDYRLISRGAATASVLLAAAMFYEPPFSIFSWFAHGAVLLILIGTARIAHTRSKHHHHPKEPST